MLLHKTKSILSDLIAFPTVSSNSNLELIAYTTDVLTNCGARIAMTLDETGTKANLFASLGPEIDGGIVLSGHTDVVPVNEDEWQSDPFTLRGGGRPSLWAWHLRHEGLHCRNACHGATLCRT